MCSPKNFAVADELPIRQANTMNHTQPILPPWLALHADPADSEISALTGLIAELDGPADELGVWSGELWATLVAKGVHRWSIPANRGGTECARIPLLTRYARIAEGSLTAAFILSQHDAGVRRLAAAGERPVARWWLDALAAGLAFTTVGISHLTTSKRLGANALRASLDGDHYRLDGVMPWVTGAEKADLFVAGAALENGGQILIALPADREGVSVRPSFRLAALQASCTAEVACENVYVAETDLLDGPSANVISHPGAAGTGGLETSALALGQARAAIGALETETATRAELSEAVHALSATWMEVWNSLISAANGVPDTATSGQVRGNANDLVLRATQAYLTARKGSGFLRDEPAQRWARQALFFLVWSCPGPVAQATIRDLAGLCDG